MAIGFYSTKEKYGEFSNFSAFGLELDGKWYPTSEHYFQAQKFEDAEHCEKIRLAKSPMVAARLGRTRKVEMRSDWEDVKVDVMRMAVHKKFEAHAELATLLLSTGEEELIEAAPGDYFWGCGKDGSGQNWLGRILMEVREELQTKVERRKSKVMNRDNRRKIGNQTVEIADRGWYEIDGHGRIDIASQVLHCLTNTRIYTPGELDGLLTREHSDAYQTVLTVENETTLSAAQRLVVEQGLSKTLCLNFASAKNPGGGFLGGSQAQEESLARSSALYASLLTQNAYYETNRACRTALYTDHMILSPDVPVFRADDGSLLPEPYSLSILTSPAVNAGAVRKNEQDKEPMIIPIMTQRIAKVLAIAAAQGYEHLVLGAWGCGVFRNDPAEIAKLFAEALLDGGRFSHSFESVTFAVLDGTDDERIISPFRNDFARGALK